MTIYCPTHVSYTCGCWRREQEEARRAAQAAADRAAAAALNLFASPTTPPSNGTSTSDAAAESLSEAQINAGHRKVLNALWRRRDGLTDEDLQRVTGLNPSTERPRRLELVERGLVEDSGETRATKSGRQAVVWRLTARALALAERRKAVA